MAWERFQAKINRLLHFQYHPPLLSSAELSLGPDDIDQQLDGQKGSSLFLRNFSQDQIWQALKDVGICDSLKQKGYDDLVLDYYSEERFIHRLNLYWQTPDPEKLIGQIIVREGSFRPKTFPLSTVKIKSVDLLFIEWILMQDIRGEFTKKRKQLPGQIYPGLGVGRQVVRLLVHIARTMGKDGILNIPEYYHNARFYQFRGDFRFFDPRMWAQVEAVRRDLPEMNIADLSLAIHLGCLLETRSAKTFVWQPQEQIRPLSPALKEHFGCEEYSRIVDRTMDQVSYRFDERLFVERHKQYEENLWNTKD